MTQQYSKKVIEHFTNPKNMGEMKNPEGVGEIGNPTCGDVMKVYIKINKNKEGEKYIQDIKFQTFGCAAAIASSSMTTEIAKGKTLEVAEKLTMNDVINELGELPKIKMHCSSMAIQGLRKAIENYENKK
ncbi:MAG TPA: iron-sulfur cluster assembly scaffold protein [Candidatus Nanoarchaeia archaeon]|nr:iron-sulfur cluster assembly scaffold protein [Candidatus Nanoarchaeia archaeon]